MSLHRLAESIPTPAAHAVGVGSGLTGLALYAELAQPLTIIMGLAVAGLAGLGAIFYAAYWALKMYAKWRRIRRGDYAE